MSMIENEKAALDLKTIEYFDNIEEISGNALQRNNDKCENAFDIADLRMIFHYDRVELKTYFEWQMKLFEPVEERMVFANICIWSDDSADELYSLMSGNDICGFSVISEDSGKKYEIFLKNNKNVGKVLFAWCEAEHKGWVNIHPDTLQRFMDVSHMLTPLLSRMCNSMNARMLHSAAIVHKGEAVLLIGLSNSGKSTLAAACLDRGMQYVSDDTILYRIDDGAVFPICSTLHLTPGSLYRLPFLAEKVEKGMIETAPGRGEKRHLDLSSFSDKIVFGARAKMIICPVINEGAMPKIEPIDKNKAIVPLLYSSAELLGEKRNPNYLTVVMNTLRKLPTWQYTLSPDFCGNADMLKDFLNKIYE